MGTINANTNASIESLNSYINTYASAAGVDASVKTSATDPSQVVVTFTGSSGVSCSTTISLPALEEAGDTQENMAALNDTLQSLAAGCNSPGVTTSSVSATLFDIYACLSLLLEVEQEQKETASIARQQEHTAIESTMLSQAESIRAAAQTSFNYGLASAIVGTCMTTASTVMTCVSTCKTFSAMSNSGVTQASSDLKAAQADVKAAKAETATLQKTDVTGEPLSAEAREASMPKSAETAQKVAAADVKVQNAEAGVESAKNQLTTAQGDLKAAETELSGAKGQLEQAKANGTKEEIQTAEQNVKNCEAKVSDCQKAVGEGEKAVNTAKSFLNDAQVERADAITEHKAALNLDVENLTNEFNTAMAQLTPESQKAISEGQATAPEGENAENYKKASDAKKALDGAKATQTAELKQMTPKLISGMEAKLEVAQGKYTQTVTNLNSSPEFQKAQALERLSGCANSFGQSISKVFDTIGHYEEEMARGEQKEMDAAVEGERALLDQYNELYSGAQDMINSVLQLMQAIQEAENQSNQQAINV